MAKPISNDYPMIPSVHWIMVAVPLLPALLVSALVLSIFAVGFVSVVLAAACLLGPAVALVAYCTTTIRLFRNRLEFETGLIRRLNHDLPVARIESVGLEQSLLGRMLGYGVLTITAVGGSTSRTAPIYDPYEFRARIWAVMSLSID